MLLFIYLFILASSSQTWPWTSDPHVFISQVLGFQESVTTSAWFPKLRVNDLNFPHPLEAEQTNHSQLKSRKGTRGEEKNTWKTPRPDVVVPVVNLTLGELGQNDWHGFEVSLGYMLTTCFKIALKKMQLRRVRLGWGLESPEKVSEQANRTSDQLNQSL